MIGPMSRYWYSTLYRGADGDFWGTRAPVRIPPHPSDAWHTVTDADRDRLDLIAFRHWGDVRLWWVLAEANGIGDPLDVPSGTSLRVPSFERVMMRVVR